MDSNFKQKQYFDLRNEISKKVDRIETLATFCVTASIAIIGFIIKNSADQMLFFLLIPFILICSYRAFRNRKEIIGISDFIVKNEMEQDGYEWEKECSQKRKKSNYSFKYFEFIAMMLASCGAYYVYIVSKGVDWKTWWILLIWFISILAEGAITLKMSNVKK